MSGRLHAAKLIVLRAAENLEITESLTVFGDEDLVSPEHSYTKDLSAIEAAHNLLDLALENYARIWNEENHV